MKTKNYIIYNIEKYKKEQRRAIIELIIATATLILSVVNVVNLSNLKMKNTELENKVQEYQDKIVYYKHTYEGEV